MSMKSKLGHQFLLTVLLVGTFIVERAGLSPRQRLAAARAATANQELVADELAAPANEDGRTAGKARAVLLATAGRGASEPQAVWAMLGRIWALSLPGR